jgi:hypothetical protein
MPLFAVISPSVVEFILYKIKTRQQQDQEGGGSGYRALFLVCLLVLVVSSVLIFFATILVLDYEDSSWMCAMIIGLMVSVFILYRKMFKMPQREKAKSKAVAFILSCLAVVFLIFNAYLLFVLGFEIPAVIVILLIISMMIAILVLCNKIYRERDHEQLDQTGRSFLVICFAIIVLMIAFPLTNLCIALSAGGWKYRWMERYKGASKETFVAVFGQPARDHEQYLSYGNVPWYQYPLSDDQLDVSVENNKINGFIWH